MVLYIHTYSAPVEGTMRRSVQLLKPQVQYLYTKDP
jgi:hypothetical protein